MATLAEPSADEQFRAAFRAWGLDVDAVPVAEATARLRGRPGPVVTEVIAALDEWAAERRRRGSAARWRRLAELAQALDDDPGSRRRELRVLLARGNLVRERGLSALAVALRPVPVPYDVGWGEDRGRLRRLAAETDPAAEPVLGLLTLARALQGTGEDALAERLLRSAVRARPREVVLHEALGHLLTEQRPPRWGEAVECYAVARALRPELGESLANALVQGGRASEGLALYERLVAERPDNPWLHAQRGYALGIQGCHKEAEEAYRAALRLKPDHAYAHHGLGAALDAQGRPKEAEDAFREATRFQPNFPEAHNNLGNALVHLGRDEEAEEAYREAIRLRPEDLLPHYNLGNALRNLGRDEEAEASYREAIRLQPEDPRAHCNLGNLLGDRGRYQEAEAAFRAARRLQPDFPEAHYGLGYALQGQRHPQEAEASYREALRLKPDYPKAHNNLGNLLVLQGRYPEAEAAFREALRIQPDYARAHYNLGNALSDQGRHKEAEASYREAVRLQPDYPEAHCNLGVSLGQQGRYREAEAACREALRLRPDFPEAHYSLSLALFPQGRGKEAEAASREAVRLQPDYPKAHYSLGNALAAQGRYQEAEASYREALRLKPDYPEAHCNLGHAVREQGRFTEALEELRRGHALGSQRPGWRYPSADWVRQCERLVELDRQLPAVLRGEAEPATPSEWLELAALCQRPCKRRHTAAARLYAGAFAADPKLAADLRQQHRYTAACSAALAAAGQGGDAERLPDKVIVMLRRQALRWLRADLALYEKMAGRDEAAARQTVRPRMHHWQQHADLATVRDPAALAQLPEDERQAWRQLWDEVAALLQKVEGTK
jgi:Flp pilus assembly protein TadD